jgi:hypothetical protein
MEHDRLSQPGASIPVMTRQTILAPGVAGWVGGNF